MVLPPVRCHEMEDLQCSFKNQWMPDASSMPVQGTPSLKLRLALGDGLCHIHVCRGSICDVEAL